MKSAPKKSYGGESEFTRFKELWQELPDSEQKRWREIFVSKIGQTKIRKMIYAEYRIRLTRDSQLNYFRSGDAEELEREYQAAKMIRYERKLRKLHPNWTRDRIRNEVLDMCYFRVLRDRDYKLGIQTMAADSKLEAVQINRNRFKESLRKKLETGLDQLGQALKDTPEAMELYQQMRELVAKETQ